MSRGEQIQTERRRRKSDELSGVRKRLSVDESKLDREKYEYRWINDVGDRVHQLTVQDDWDIVTQRDGSGSDVSVAAGTGERGATFRAVLVRKPKNLYNDDYAAQQRRIDETEATMRNPRGDQTYTPGTRDGSGPAMKVAVDNRG